MNPFLRPRRPAPGTRARLDRGFTLIELMIAVAIVAILAAVALPSYTEHVRKSHRAEAQAYLMTVANRQHQFLVDTRSFAPLASVGVPVPGAVSTHYSVTIDVQPGPPPTFVITAAPKGKQTAERCGTLTIDHTGAKQAAVPGCW